MIVTGYSRVSTTAQVNGEGLEVQREAIETFCRHHELVIGRWCSDDGVSGTTDLENRHGLAEAVSYSEGIVVYRLDRLARDLILQETILDHCQRQGVTVYSCSEAENETIRNDPDDPSRKMLRQIMGAVAEYERAMIRLRLTAGVNRKRELGGYIGGTTPYGWKVYEGELVLDPPQQKTLGRMLELRGEGLSLRAVGAALDREGHRPPKAEKWSAQTIKNILAANPITGERDQDSTESPL